MTEVSLLCVGSWAKVTQKNAFWLSTHMSPGLPATHIYSHAAAVPLGQWKEGRNLGLGAGLASLSKLSCSRNRETDIGCFLVRGRICGAKEELEGSASASWQEEKGGFSCMAEGLILWGLSFTPREEKSVAIPCSKSSTQVACWITHM